MTDLKDIMPGDSRRIKIEPPCTEKIDTFTGRDALKMTRPVRDSLVSARVTINRDSSGSEGTAAPVQRGPVSLDMEEYIHKTSNDYVHLSRSLLVRVRLERPDGDTVSLLCSSEEVAARNIRLLLPCQLGLAEGTILDMDLFLNPEREPTAIHGKVRSVTRTGNEDIVRYIVEVEFCHIPGYTSREVAVFLRTVQAAKRCQLIA